MRMSRRVLLAGAGALSTGAVFATPARAAPRIHLRLLETSDLHMFAADWDYFKQKHDPTVGLDRLASLIEAARGEAPNSLLFDNGDIIQGNPLGDFVAEHAEVVQTAVHPMFRAMNLLGYDAATVGNHEFNYSLAFLEAALKGANFPFVCANIARVGGEMFLSPFRILERTLRDEDGAAHKLRIGVVGFTPPQIMTWDKSHLEGRITCDDILAVARRVIPALRAQCDLVIALSHSGISGGAPAAFEENASLHLAQIPGIDAIFTGHSHRVFPGPDYANREGIDAERGTLAGIPAVMPGFWGSHLGVIDLALARDGERWTIANFTTQARSTYRREGARVIPLVEASPRIDAAIEPEHAATAQWIAEPVGRFAEPVHSYFVFAGLDPASALVNAAQTAYVRSLLAGSPHEGLPILSAAAPFKAGYTPDAYIDIAAGPVARRDIADLYTYPNTVSAVRVTGAIVREWLEFSARIFNRLDPAQAAPQPLVDRQVPSLTYRIDPGQATRHDRSGRVITPTAQRIVDLRFEGQPLDDVREFVVVTNNYRSDGGGSFPGLDGSRTILRAPDTNRDVVLKFVQAGQPGDILFRSPWTFAALGAPRTVWFDSAMAAGAHLGDVPGLRAAGAGAAGYARFEFDIG